MKTTKQTHPELPRIRTSLGSGDRCLEFLTFAGGRRMSIDLGILCGVSEGDECNLSGQIKHRWGVLHTHGSAVPTRHSYEDLMELMYPHEIEGLG